MANPTTLWRSRVMAPPLPLGPLGTMAAAAAAITAIPASTDGMATSGFNTAAISMEKPRVTKADSPYHFQMTAPSLPLGPCTTTTMASIQATHVSTSGIQTTRHGIKSTAISMGKQVMSAAAQSHFQAMAAQWPSEALQAMAMQDNVIQAPCGCSASITLLPPSPSALMSPLSKQEKRQPSRSHSQKTPPTSFNPTSPSPAAPSPTGTLHRRPPIPPPSRPTTTAPPMA